MTSLQYPIGPFEPGEGLPDADERTGLIARISALPGRARAAVAGLGDAELDMPYREGGWTPRQIVHHMADSHMNAFTRVKLGMTEEHPTIRPYDQAAWSELPDTLQVPVEASLGLLDGLHERWVRLLASMDDADHARPVMHPEVGDVTLGYFLRLYAWHGDHHTTQIEQLRERQGW
jgi:uncharacterized damage-inducible protein DinB